ncbi:acyl-CoA-binding protein-like [Pyrus ussuriensis x Pyrus communis]|uniref:Acyl-CoA-binding protein-like n=1 Tax=Pyrus ussuriensis x Pyrus communis TaxID=2448454 RepID=A0A5N5H6S4_9ROSA|nr:acyl-CoA-binding protein-like [Pyrus ussuriensis x Pyrus communis]
MALQLEEEFKEYAEKAKSLPPRTTDADKLILYGLYKQATVGSVNISDPTERAKWDAWKAVDEEHEEAMTEYIVKVKHLQQQEVAST